jgi:hypothetical protein
MNLEEYEAPKTRPKSPKEMVEEDLITMGTLCLQNDDEEGAESCFERAGLNEEEIKKLKKQIRMKKRRLS